ncbi:hypothetical protein E4U58_001774 [Claviceps cyperi]|nr:hypothetical protein E4U58_001774 [Claviceps cyperi]
MRQTDEASYTWFLTELKALFESSGIQVELWLTENEAPLVNALQAVFSTSLINMCTWHMNKDVISYLQTQLSAQFGRHRVALMDSPTVADYDIRLADCERMSPDATAYLKRYWLNNHKKKLVSYILWLFRRLHPLYQDHVDTIQHLDGKDDATIASYCEHPLYQGVLFKITRYALSPNLRPLKYARAELEKQQLGSSYRNGASFGLSRAVLKSRRLRRGARGADAQMTGSPE